MYETVHPHDAWSRTVFQQLKDAGVTLFSYIPDAGNARLAELAEEDNQTRVVLLTTEEEGIAVAAGADLVGEKAVVMMQSSGVGNCPNFLSFVKGGGFPLLMIVSMRGDHGEQNPWQFPMGQAVEPILDAMGVITFRVDKAEELEGGMSAAINTAFKGGCASALILGQSFLGAKAF
ncbi:thiamine pyrophosphate-binding protein [Rhodospirillales bacterium]|nr:thiamine pyrophosphate-binding protein [Rhodospirillales bacterium]